MAIILVLVVYPLSEGPVFWIQDNYGTDRTREVYLAFYGPIEWCGDQSDFIMSVHDSYLHFCWGKQDFAREF
jgi:hypothetical protein